MNYFFNLYGCPLEDTLYNDGYFQIHDAYVEYT